MYGQGTAAVPLPLLVRVLQALHTALAPFNLLCVQRTVRIEPHEACVLCFDVFPV